MMDLSSLLVGGIPLIIVIFGLVEFIKSFGLSGKIVTSLSMVLGLLFGIAYKIGVDGLPVDFMGWFIVVVFGLALGLVASGFYKFADARFPSKQ
jgi:hypothetical protein